MRSVGDGAFRALFERALDAVLIADQEGRYVAANSAAGELLGLSPERLINHRIDDFLLSQESRFEDVWRAFLKQGHLEGEVSLRRVNGDVIDVEFRATAHIQPGLHLSILRDITRRKRAEEALEGMIQELARSNTELQRFAYMASHDLQEPLRTIASFAQLLAKRYRGQLGEEGDELLAYITDGTERMRSLIDALLSYSRVVNARGRELPVIPFAEALELALSNLRNVIDESEIEITVDQLPNVKGDPVQLSQLMQNLIGNSIKYRRDETLKVHLGCRRKGEHWAFSLSDNGIGIPGEQQQRVFEAFHRLHGGEIPGTGIGLAICQKIVENHGGNIWVESIPGKGSTFFFTVRD